jgi:RimJ/RimL family protein N-acetyltransferase
MDDPLPVLTERTRLRRLAVADLADFQRYRNDPDVGRWQGWKGMDDGAATGFLQEMADSDFCPPGRWFQLGIARRDSDQLIGDIGVHMHGGAGLLAELGFTLTPAAQGRGLATEAVGAALQMLLQHTPVQRIVSVADTRNAASLALLQRLGLRRFALLPAIFGGQPCVEAHFAWHRHGRVPVQLRLASLADAAAVAELLIVSRRVLMPFVTWAHSDDELRGWVAEQLVPSGGVTLALAHGRVVGVLALSTQADAHWIDQLYVHPAQAACGVGATLLAHALAWAAAHDAALPVRLYTFQANAHAREFYERHGFVAVALSDGVANEERCPDVLYERLAAPSTMPA